MPDVLVRNIEKSVLERLKARAKENGRSLQNELLLLFTSFAEESPSTSIETAKKIRDALRGRVHTDSAGLLREDRST